MSSDESSCIDCDSSSKDSDNDDSMEEDISVTSEEEDIPSWSKLPPLILEKIYSYLDRRDQSRMSLVCHNWSREYSSPCIWRKVKFLLPEKEYTLEVCPEVRFAQKYGHMFHDVEITCRRVRYNLIRVIGTQLKLFLQALAHNAELLSVSFINMRLYFRHLEGRVLNDIFRNILDFFMSQRNLKSVTLKNMQLGKNDGMELFRIICLNNAGILRNLKLEEFISETREDHLTSFDSLLTFNGLMNLENAVIDYSDILENIVMSYYEYEKHPDFCGRRSKLKNLEIICDGSKNVNFQGIPSDVWRFCRKHFPKLRIKIYFLTGSRVRNQIDRFVVPHMPIISLDFRVNKRQATHPADEIGSLLRYFLACGVNLLLEELCVIWVQSPNNFVPDVMNFVDECTRLRVLQLYIYHPVDSLDTLFNSWVENRPFALEAVHITIAKTVRDDVSSYSKLVDDYAPVLQALGLTLILTVDSRDR